MKKTFLVLLNLMVASCLWAITNPDGSKDKATVCRDIINLNNGWKTHLLTADEQKKLNAKSGDSFSSAVVSPEAFTTVNVPHNWDDYHGYRQLVHGNLHGAALYTKDFIIRKKRRSRRYFLYFEGIGTYATVKVNGRDLGHHPVGRTTLTLDVTEALESGRNTVEVLAEHPAIITDMPWICGGCSSEWGFSEGSQPLGIYRPVRLVITDEIRIEPFGVHIWNNTTADSVFIETEIKNYGKERADFEYTGCFHEADGRKVAQSAKKVSLEAGETKVISQAFAIDSPRLWNPGTPYLYNLSSTIKKRGRIIDEVNTPYGICTYSWPAKRGDGDGRFYFNGKPVLINGTCEYEHLFGNSHAFSKEQIDARVKMIRNAGFNAVRDAHQPHNLRYLQHWDRTGMMFWPQFSSHVWYDTPEFRQNFKRLLRQWIKERRNSPSVIAWGLQNESTLPTDFAKECTEIIREMDPMARDMRVVTTCNGGSGTDWNVIQNWSGTYGGDIFKYGEELTRPNQLLNGEYGAWRTLGYHTEPCAFDPQGPWSEEHMCQILETKVGQAEKVRDKVCGHFQWLFSTHDNPGRPRQPDEAYRMIDKVGPFNYKGLVSPWEEPTDAYYMYKGNYTKASEAPFVYIISHTWPRRFNGPRNATLEAYSNCDSVRLFNDALDGQFLGTRTKGETGTHFVWENVMVRYNVIRAEGYHAGRKVAEDLIVLENLDTAPGFASLKQTPQTDLVKGAENYNYVYRMNCGGDEYTDGFGQTWLRDDSVFSRSWAQEFKGLNPYLASQRVTYDPISGTNEWKLMQTFRFGRHKLSYKFPLPDGRYRVELYFIEPWHGTGGGAGTDCKGLRIFDVAVNGTTVINDLDIWAEAGHDKVLKKVLECDVSGGCLTIDFPEVKAGQAVISAIAIATKASHVHADIPQETSEWNWETADREVVAKLPADKMPKEENARATTTYKAKDTTCTGLFTWRDDNGEKTACFKGTGTIEWTFTVGLAQTYVFRFGFMNQSGKSAIAHINVMDQDGNIVREGAVTFPVTSGRWNNINTTTGGFINAGTYKVSLSLPDGVDIAFKSLDIQ